MKEFVMKDGERCLPPGNADIIDVSLFTDIGEIQFELVKYIRHW